MILFIATDANNLFDLSLISKHQFQNVFYSFVSILYSKMKICGLHQQKSFFQLLQISNVWHYRSVAIPMNFSVTVLQVISFKLAELIASSMSELERLVSQKTPLPGLWQHVLSDTMGTTLKALSSAFSRYLMTPEISTISEVFILYAIIESF